MQSTGSCVCVCVCFSGGLAKYQSLLIMFVVCLCVSDSGNQSVRDCNA